MHTPFHLNFLYEKKLVHAIHKCLQPGVVVVRQQDGWQLLRTENTRFGKVQTDPFTVLIPPFPAH
jgi:hypothetical protein